MAAHKEAGAIEALRLIRNAEKVASFCNDVVGDISSIVQRHYGGGHRCAPAGELFHPKYYNLHRRFRPGIRADHRRKSPWEKYRYEQQ